MEGTPLWETLILERPLFGAVIIAVVTLIVAGYFNTRGRLRPLLVSLGIGVAAAVGVYVTGSSIETPREAAKRNTRALVEAVVEADPSRADALLSQQFRALAGGTPANMPPDDRTWLLSVINGIEGVITRNSIDIEGAATDGPDFVTVRFSASTSVPRASSVSSEWEVDWRRTASGWKAMRLESLSFWGQSTAADTWLPWARRHARSYGF